MPDLTVDYFRKDLANTIMRQIDDWCVKTYDDGFRNHLGASVIGAECTRATWYSWRWFAKPKTTGREYRLFQRGHLEEFRYTDYIRGIGAELHTHDTNLPPKANGEPQQFRVSKLGGHFGGSLDGIVSYAHIGVPGYMLAEFKTKGAGKDGTGAKFLELKQKGIMLTNPQHYDQMCTYGWAYDLHYASYFSVNKNDDDIHHEIVPLNFDRAAEVEKKAAYILRQRTPPAKLSMVPTHYKCKGCDFREVCHEDRVPLKNCRTCKHSQPIDGGLWYCDGWKGAIPAEVMATGCDQWDFIR